METSAYKEMQAHLQRLLERVSALHSLSAQPTTVRRLTAEEVCKALSITKRALQYYRSAGIIPYTALGNKVLFLMYLHTCINSSFGHCIFAAKTYCNPIMERLDEILEIVREIREDIAYMKRHRNMLCGTPILEVSEVCDLLKISDRQLRRYCVSGQLTGFHFGRRLMFSTAEISRFVERIDTECRQRKELKNRIRNL